MAKLQTKILENFSGNIGDLNFYKWKNQFVIRSKRIPTKKPPTEAQVLSRNKFRFLNQLYKKLKQVTKVGFESFTHSMTDRNAFFKYNYSAISKTETELKIHYPDLILSKGNSRNKQLIDAGFNQKFFTLNWKNLNHPIEDEKLCFVFLPSEESEIIYLEIPSSLEKLEMEIPFTKNTSRFFVYYFTKNKKDVSNSEFIGEFLN